MNNPPLPAGWEETKHFPFGIFRQTFFFRESYRSKRATNTEAVIVCDRRSLCRGAKFLRPGHRCPDSKTHLFIERNANGDVFRVVANPPFGYSAAGLFFQ